MSRYVNDIPFNNNIDFVFSKTNQYLTSNGFNYTQYDGENVFQKGHGFMTAPMFVKVSFLNGVVRIEAWLKYALFPGVYLGEIGIDGFYAYAIKKRLNDYVTYVELMIKREAPSFNNSNPTSVPQFQAQNNGFNPNFNNVGQASAPQQNLGYNTNAFGTQAQGFSQPGFNNSGLPGRKPTSRKDYIDNFASMSTRKDIKNIAILCYVIAGINAVLAIFLNPLSLIDASILLGLALGMHLGKSKICAICILVLSCIEVVVAVAVSGNFGGYLWIIAGIWAVITFSKIDKSYNAMIKN